MPILNPIDFFELRRKALVDMMEFSGFQTIDMAPVVKTGFVFQEAVFDPKVDKFNIIIEDWYDDPTAGRINLREWKVALTAETIDYGIKQAMEAYRREYLRRMVPNPVEFFNPLVFNQNNP